MEKRKLATTCGNNLMSSGFCQTSQQKLISELSMITDNTAIVQNTGEWENIHPNKSMPSRATGTRLRLRLSNIFHLDKEEIGLFRILCAGPGTQGKSQEAICQSPRIQR